MSLFTLSKEPLSNSAILKMLTAVRNNALSPLSGYKVGTVVEVQLNENLYFYTSGANVEDSAHNRLSIHSEQNALANAITLLGGYTKFSSLWVMPAPADSVADANQTAAKPCGHCRQIMLSLAQPGAKVYTVTLDGRFSLADNFEEGRFLPDAFSERDLNFQVESSNPSSHSNTIDFHTKLKAWEPFNEPKNLSTDEIKAYLQRLSPHIISKNFQMSAVTACILKCHNGYYAPGVLMQDVAFLTTDAIYAAIGNAIRRFSNKELQFDEIHLASDNLYPGQLTSAEIESLILGGYIHDQTVVHFYTQRQHAVYTFTQCRLARNKILDQTTKHNSSLEYTVI